MKLIKIILAILLLALFSCDFMQEQKFFDECQKSLVNFQKLKENLLIPNYFFSDTLDWENNYVAEKRSGEFDVNNYFKALNHLSMEPGYVLDWVYRNDIGEPVIYARKTNQNPYQNFKEYLFKVGSIRKLLQIDYLQHIQIDTTSMGYFQFIILELMGAQFYRTESAFYQNDATIVCSIEEIKNAFENHIYHLNKEYLKPIISEAKLIDLKPKVIKKEKEVDICVTYFTAWGGIKRHSCTVSRNFPHKISKIKDSVLIEYNCRIAPLMKNQFIDECRKSLSDFKDLKKDLVIPDNFMVENPRKKGGEFDVNDYFKTLNHLSMESGFVLDYVYGFNIIGGSPYIFARRKSRPPFKNLKQYINNIGDEEKIKSEAYLKHIKTDDTLLGYFQLIILKIMGYQFYQYQHASYNDRTIVCNLDDLKNSISNNREYFKEESIASFLFEVLHYDLNPYVFLLDKEAYVNIAYFTAWGGLKNYSCTISRNFPHELSNIKDTVIVKYNCGVLF